MQSFKSYVTALEQVGFNTASGKYYCNLSEDEDSKELLSFNTASGKYYCNELILRQVWNQRQISFNTASGKYYCNEFKNLVRHLGEGRFNTASGKYYCNSRPYKASIHGGLKIGFGKPHTVNGQNALPFDPQGLWI